MLPPAPPPSDRHPLEDPRTAAALLEALAARELPAVFATLTRYLDLLVGQDRLRSARVAGIVDQIDRAGRVHYLNATARLVRSPSDLDPAARQRLWAAGGQYLVALADAYERAMPNPESLAARVSALDVHGVRALARATRLRAAAIKWDALRYTSEFGSWPALYRLYRLAEAHRVAGREVVIYSGGGLSSVRQELLKALMFAVSVPGSLLPSEIDASDRIIAHFSEHFVLSAEADASLAWSFDPDSARPPARCPDWAPAGGKARRFGPGLAGDLVRYLAREGAADGARTELPGLADSEPLAIRATSLHLAARWCSPVPRRHPRRRAAARIEVLHGYHEVAHAVTGGRILAPQEPWVIENQSEGGVGTIAMDRRGNWVEVGRLLAYREAEDGAWRTGLVRHLRVHREQTRCIGIEVLGAGGMAVRVRPVPADIRSGWLRCIWLGANAATERSVRLLGPREFFLAARRLQMRIGERTYLLRPTALLHTGADFQVGAFAPVPVPRS